ncbi:hypothetical protein G6F68_014725 [Rhizopus microsporus]|nr:hypothetical protein G6F69_009548 [Rhizopus microsporus]KAG1223864.1 hypothetical protein G6F67_009590 [Rhizopus microsporus]KAG1246240.1 hypothetical protein G6F68_014725 [Rhizopus microsporus]
MKPKSTALAVMESSGRGGGSIFLWGCIIAEGPGNLVKIDVGLGSALYCQILEEDLLGTLDYYEISKNHVYLLHDNDPKYSEGQNWQDVCQLRGLSLTIRR